jgi:hypothetical protein
VLLEIEKAVRNHLTDLKYDTEDRELGAFDEHVEPDRTPLPDAVNRFGRNEMDK